MYQIKAHQVKVPKQKQLKSVLHLGVGIIPVVFGQHQFLTIGKI